MGQRGNSDRALAYAVGTALEAPRATLPRRLPPIETSGDSVAPSRGSAGEPDAAPRGALAESGSARSIETVEVAPRQDEHEPQPPAAQMAATRRRASVSIERPSWLVNRGSKRLSMVEFARVLGSLDDAPEDQIGFDAPLGCGCAVS